MIREIVKDPIFLQQKSAPASEADVPVGLDLLDTLHAHRETCVGLAANMIGVSRRHTLSDVQPGDRSVLRPIRSRGRLSFPDGNPKGQTFP